MSAMPHMVSTVRAGTVVRATVGLAFLTVATTTVLTFVMSGEFPAGVLVPMISDTFVYPPASYVGRVGIGLVGFLLAITVCVVRSYLSLFACGDTPPRTNVPWRVVTTLHSFIGCVASFSLCVVAAVNERENLKVHFSFAVFFLTGTAVWHACVLAQLRYTHPRCTTCESLALKSVCVGAEIASLISFFTLCFVDLKRYYQIAAISEWLAVASIGSFTWSLGTELDGECFTGEFKAGFTCPKDTVTGMDGNSSGWMDGESKTTGMTLGSFWSGRAPGREMLDVLVLTRTDTEV